MKYLAGFELLLWGGGGNRDSLCFSGWHRPHCINQDGLELRDRLTLPGHSLELLVLLLQLSRSCEHRCMVLIYE